MLRNEIILAALKCLKFVTTFEKNYNVIFDEAGYEDTPANTAFLTMLVNEFEKGD